MTTVWVGASLKMYLGVARTEAWCREVHTLAGDEPSVQQGHTEMAILPSFVALSRALSIFGDGVVSVGAQDLATADEGAYTGEVSGKDLAEIGCRYAEVGHMERRRLFGEDDHMVAQKFAAALRNGLQPVLCVGEPEQARPRQSANTVLQQFHSARSLVPDGLEQAPVVLAYEPHWAIGRVRPAEPDYVRAVCDVLQEELLGHRSVRLVYGGSAGPGLLTQLDDSVDGLFLGRYAHDPDGLRQVVAEAASVGRG